jgi:acyl carrier protein
MESEDASESLSADDELFELGLNSLMLAQLLIQLEAELGVDPFSEQVSITDIRSVSDLVNAYEQAIEARSQGEG